MSFFADILQNPGRKTGSAIILKGLEGSGKSLIGDEFIKIVGPRHAFTLASEEQVTGRFNAHLALALFCQMEEALFAGSNAFRTFKDLVTRESLSMEMKGIDIVTVPNYTRFMMTTNEKWVVPAGADARRWFISEVILPDMTDDERFTYFDEIRSEMRSGGREAWMAELLTWKINEGLLRKPPNTWELESQRLESLTIPQQFWLGVLDENSAEIFPQGDEDDWPVATEFERLLSERYMDHCLKRGAKFKANTTEFKNSMREMLCLGEPRQKEIKGKNARRYRVMNVSKIKAKVIEKLGLDPDALK
nr:primase-helicase family protein [Falsiroseomonas tokyonensis]